MIRLRIAFRGNAWVLDLPGPVVLFGRGWAHDIMIPSDTVSRRHGRIFEQDGRLKVSDDGSTHGTAVNGEIIRHTRPIGPDDVVEAGGMRMQGELIDGPAVATADELALLERGSDEPAALLEGVRKSAGLLSAVLSRDDAPSLVIEALADCPAPSIRSAVARHPSAPAAAIRRLAHSVPRDVARNPALSLLLLEAPDLATILALW